LNKVWPKRNRVYPILAEFICHGLRSSIRCCSGYTVSGTVKIQAGTR
jgi:hypothetical protein